MSALAVLLCALVTADGEHRGGELPAAHGEEHGRSRSGGHAASPASDFERTRLAYERNDYARVISLCRPLLYPSILLPTPEQVTEAHRMLGIAYFKTRDEPAAEREFSILLNDNPDFHLDRLVDGVEVAQFVDGMRQRMEDELRRIKELERERLESEQKKAAEERKKREAQLTIRYVDREAIRNPYLVNFLPLGAGQFQNGEREKGWAFLIAEGTLGGASLGLWIAKQELYPDGKVHTPGQSEGAATALQLARITTGGAFFALWAVGIWDSLRHYVPVSYKTSPIVPTPTPLSRGAGLEWSGRF
jgi:hypothetical protein